MDMDGVNISGSYLGMTMPLNAWSEAMREVEGVVDEMTKK